MPSYTYESTINPVPSRTMNTSCDFQKRQSKSKSKSIRKHKPDIVPSDHTMIVHTHNSPSSAPRPSPGPPSITTSTPYSLQCPQPLQEDPNTDSESAATRTPALKKPLSTLPTLLPPLPLEPRQHHQQQKQQHQYQCNVAMDVDSDENDGNSNSQNSGNLSGSASGIENNSDGEQDNGHAIASPAASPATPVPTTATNPISSDLMQHCLLFPTYATRHSHSGSKDPLDWNVRVRGWAFSKRSNRRKRLVMSMARKIAGVAKDEHKVLENLESRFGMFLTSNTPGAQFSIQCVGLASTTHMELAGDFETHDHDPNVDVLLDELSTTDGAMAVAEVIHQKELFRKSLELDRVNILNALSHEHSDEQSHQKAQKRIDQPIVPLQHATVVALKSSEPGNVQRAMDDERNAQQNEDSLLQAQQTATRCQDEDGEEDIKEGNGSYAASSDTPPRNDLSQRGPAEGENSIAGRLSKGAALIKNAMKKVKPGVMSQSSNNSSMDSLRTLPQHNTKADNNISDISAGEPAIRPGAINRAVSGDSVLSQSVTDYEDLGQGRFPTVRISSRPGGHFDGTLRMSHAEIEAHRQSNTDGGHPKFLRLHGHHQNMVDTSHGIVNLIDPEGISIISDIDDTIKDTNVTAGAKIILRNTFLKEMQEVKGMASVYKGWWARGAAIHYVSNSPWQLIPSLLEFFHTHKFPPGSAHLRMHDSVLKTYFTTPGESKRQHIREILMDFPDRKFILVGDSGEIDMEIYTEMALEFPDQILRIFIRDITTARLREMVSKMPPTRGRSFSSLLHPKVPITAAVSGLFSHRGSQTNTCHSSTLQYNASSTHLSSSISSSNLDHEYDDQHEGNEGDDDDDGDSTGDKDDIEGPPLASLSKGKIGEQEKATMIPTGYSQHLESGRLEHHDGPMTPKLESSGPMNIAPHAIPSAASSLSTPPKSSPKLRPIAANIKAVTHSIFGSTFKRSPSNGFNLSVGKKSSHGWNSIRRRAEDGYPFPIVGLKATSSAVSLNKEEEQRSGSPYGVMNGHRDVFEGVEHQHVVLQYQHSQHQMGSHPQQQSQQQQLQQQPPRLMQRTRANTFSSSTSSPSNSMESILQMTPPFGPTPTHTPPMSPKIPIHGFCVEVETKVEASYSISNCDNHSQAGSSFGVSPGSPLAVPPSSEGLSLSPSTHSQSRAKNMLEVWLERVEQCRERLPSGVLTLFESAEELEQCEIVRKMFGKYGTTVNDRGHDWQAKDQQDQDSSVENERMKKRDEKMVRINEIKSNWRTYPSAVSLSCSSYSNDSLTLSISDSASSTVIGSPGAHRFLDHKVVEA